MSDLNSHPSREELSAYSLGQLPEEQAVAIDAHINECEPCCETIVELSSEDTFAGLLREAGRLPVEQTIDNNHRNAVQSTTGEDLPGELAIHPRYEIIRLIGKGGMGDVYKACHRKMERTVALKVINRGLFRKAEVIDRFHREVKAAAQLSHPNIVTAYDADQAGEFHFMVMEYVDGVDLARTIKDRGALPIDEACEYIRQAAIGLQHAHERGMVHRDIKPHNLMVTKDGTVKILDFGLASLAPEAIPASDAVAARSDLTAAGAIMGTPDFISPEQAEDARQADIRSDIYSLGATLYYLLSGRVPFDDGSVMHKLKSHAQFEPTPLNSVRDDVPQKLVAIASRMMAKDPDERYLTPKEVAEAVEAFLCIWQSDQVEPLQPNLSTDGNRSGSGGRKRLMSGPSRNWLPVWANWLFYISLVPIAILLFRVLLLDNVDAANASQIWFYVIPSILFSTASGLLSGIHQFNTKKFDERRVFWLTDQALLIAAILLGSVAYYFTAINDGTVRLAVVPAEDIATLGPHPLTIVDTSGKKPVGGATSTHQDDASGITTHCFKSANGRYNITLVDKVLSVNGEKYTLENSTDAIRIVDDRVEITRFVAGPENGQPSVRDNEPALSRDRARDIPNIQGTWRVTYSEDGGRIAPQEMLKELRFVIDEQDLITEIGGRKSVSTYKLDPSTNPKSLDLTENGRTKQGIYDLVGDTLRICIAESGDQRPTAFDSQPNSANDIVLILKRMKPEEASSADTDDHLHAGPMSPKLARLLIPAAASISNEDFQKFQTNPSSDAIQNKSLSLILMALDVRDQSPEEASDFRFLVEGFPHPSKIAAAMSPSRSKGYYSIIQPDYITECQITTSTDEIARGSVTFNAPKLYIGSVTFESRKHEGTWRIEKFHLPSRKISIVLGEDGKWNRKSEGQD
jgi:uncharacterized protein (TIGR03067 family)